MAAMSTDSGRAVKLSASADDDGPALAESTSSRADRMAGSSALRVSSSVAIGPWWDATPEH